MDALQDLSLHSCTQQRAAATVTAAAAAAADINNSVSTYRTRGAHQAQIDTNRAAAAAIKCGLAVRRESPNVRHDTAAV